ncbi:MAG: gliding motility-associated C-terminal domain-containing protein, partial [Bacteroidota bacterium]
SPAINITQNVIDEIPPSDCNGNNGQLSISVNRTDDPSVLFRLEWYRGRAPFTAAPIRTVEGVNNDLLSGISAGLYTVVATDLNSGCQDSEEFPLIFANLHEITLTPIDITTCVPENGEIEIILDTKGLDEADFIISIFEGPNPVGTPVETITGVTGTINYTSSNNLRSIEYTAVAINTAPGFNNCESIPKSVTLNSVAVIPNIVVGDSGNSMVCPDGGLNFDGFAEIDIDGMSPPTDYTIRWFEGQDTTSAPLLGTNFGVLSANNSRADQLPGGVYSVEVTNNLTGCVNLLPIVIQDVSPVVSIEVTTMNIIRCQADGSPVLGEVTQVDVMENNAIVGGYTFSFTDQTGNTVNPNSLPAGSYFVTAFNNSNGCGVTTEFEILDLIIGDPTVNLIRFRNPQRCFQPNISGFLEVEAVGNTGSTFTYEWFAGSTATGAPIDTDSLLNDVTIPGDYTVRVTNTASDCFVLETYTLVEDVNNLLITANSTPIISCDPDNPDGSVFAAITNSGGNDYTYTWTLPDGSTSTQNPLTGLSEAGVYMVTAVDNSDGTCMASTSVSLGIEQIFPNLMVEEIAPLTVCNEIGNGSARASVDGSFIGYTFEWFEGIDTSGDPFATGPEVSSLQAIQYTVRATDVITLCSTELPITITDGVPPIPVPTIELLSNVTSCIEPNGALSVSVDGNTSDYIFYWFIGQQVTSDTVFVGELFTGLDVGFYTVIAESLITGCISEPVTEEIIEDLVFPEFELAVTPSTCGEANGFARLILTNGANVELIVWEDANGNQTFGPNLTEVVAGFYTVTATTPLGCSTSQEIEITSEINPFNGVSRNGDGQNDIFKIDCIDQFPDNIVKIFNRAGTLVYEVEGYDNQTVFFDGVSNKGINVLGNALPDGTYFYIIDKRDGSQPLSGYLELVN